MNTFSWHLLVGSLLIWQAGTAECQDNTPYRKTIVPHDSARPLFLRVSVVNGDIRVKGGDGHEIVLEAVPREKLSPETKPEISPETAASETNFSKFVTIREEDNHYYFNLLPAVSPVDLVIQVPRGANLKLHTRAIGGIRVEKVNGEIEAESFNGDIAVIQASDTVVAHTGNGRIDVGFKSVRMDKPMSFTTVNGDVALTFPANLKAHVRMDSVTGKVISDFHIVKTANTHVAQGNAPALSGKKISGQIGSGVGGPDVLIKSLNGSIHLQKTPVEGFVDSAKGNQKAPIEAEK